MMLWEDLVPLVLHSATGILGLLANGLLFYLAIKKTPDSFKVYSILLINFAVFDFIACATALFVQQRIIPMGASLIFLSGGPCKYFGSSACYISHCITLHCYSHGMWSLLLSFLFRYFVLKYRRPKYSEVLFFLGLVYTLSIAQLILYIFAADNPNVLKQMLRRAFPQYDTSFDAISGNASIFEWKCFIVLIHITCAVFPIYAVIMWARNSILVTLENHQSMSIRTKLLHSQLLKALTYQAMLPGVFTLAVITFALGLFGICNHPLLEYSTFLLLGLIPVLSPLGTLFLVRPYQQWIYGKLGIGRGTTINPSIPYSMSRGSGNNASSGLTATTPNSDG